MKEARPHVVVFQEFNQRGEARDSIIDAVRIFLPNIEEYGEHMWGWTNELRLYNERERPRNTTTQAATLRLMWNEVPFKLTSVHTRPSEAFDDTVKILEDLNKSQDGLRNIVAGDFNLNPHSNSEPVHEYFHATGTVDTKTSAGRKGYDFFFVDWRTWEETECAQFGLIPRDFKNSARGKRGMSDHACQVMRLTPFPPKEKEKEEDDAGFSCVIV
jgi:hypothetical protein